MDEVARSEPSAQDASERRASYLELFFDLVFVYAVTQIANLIIGDTSPGGFARAALMLGMVWWAWSAFAWMTNAIDLSTPIGRVTLLLASASSFFVALAVPEAFGAAGDGSRSPTSPSASCTWWCTCTASATTRSTSGRCCARRPSGWCRR